ncbi:aminotransferase class I/II-fold pyridoxal phosphate-dependent enzyme [Bacillus cereus]|uniref:Aminotransferase class I/II-fold pyridoxal phosphate-dependent enzyme n=1 Tax=Bacillus cereus TaxID=1396 RepID=A0AAW5L2U0_BACCE|nr:aminotransferase class I/II-fold pyridoxal phosphate-dependent enzyme [Bacillus cereus]MCQ6288536.1 aminotransferase class I/II-fold pyridoxal phosphate-dependent enzyme [Bacillus cereus]MCQ6307036.1 aminotransferase class I/II-fold pyridoxal phosphate-dependent enzyme [Bacillus cereus]MCQ6317854.1 aminotransferase class I/II-fold pyridoxal phosphate-dependent enzyme [Bacillus cereus]MCQ6328970.1 aminotransferase class I/II-fold pyridoxal phosphate-dependent enzyme [Bacillus cereus]MCQ63857
MCRINLKKICCFYGSIFTIYVESKQCVLPTLSANQKNVLVCKSMSKVYALSGVRCAYLVAHPDIIHRLQIFSPPWAVSLPAQIAGVHALQDPKYYQKCYQKTASNRTLLLKALKSIPCIKVMTGVTNSLLCEFPTSIPVHHILEDCKKYGLYIRDITNMVLNIDTNIARIAIKDYETNQRIIHILQRVITQYK